MKPSEEEQLALPMMLEKLMKERGLTLKQVAELAGVPASTIGDWSNGVAPRNLFALKKLATGLGVSFSTLVFGEPEGKPTSVGELFHRENLVDGVFEVSIKRLHLK